MSHEAYLIRLFTRSISAYLIVVYYYGAGVVSKGNTRQRNASLSAISMQVDTVVEFYGFCGRLHSGPFLR